MRGAFCLILSVALALALPGEARAQEARAQTLADVRQQLSVLFVEVQRLKRELSTTGSATSGGTAGSLLERVNAIESELQRLTARTEELGFRIERVVEDGTNRIGDLEFRLCELEADCDIAELEAGTTLGGNMPPDTPDAAPETAEGTQSAEMAVGERADFERADAALEAGDWAEAAQMFEEFRSTYPGSPLGDEAGLKLGAAREGAADMPGAARAYLDVFSAAPDGPLASRALYELGRSLGALGQTSEACIMLSEVAVRFPGSEAEGDAEAEMRELGCS